MDQRLEIENILNRVNVDTELILDSEYRSISNNKLCYKEILFHDLRSGHKILIINHNLQNFSIIDLFKKTVNIQKKRILVTNIFLEPSLDRIIIEFTPMFSSA